MLTLFRIATGDNWNGILEVSEYKKNIEILWDRHLDNLLNSNSIYSQLYLAILLYARCYEPNYSTLSKPARQLSWVIHLFFCESIEIFPKQFHLGEIGHTQNVASPWATAICPWLKRPLQPHLLIRTQSGSVNHKIRK